MEKVPAEHLRNREIRRKRGMRMEIKKPLKRWWPGERLWLVSGIRARRLVIRAQPKSLHECRCQRRLKGEPLAI